MYKSFSSIVQLNEFLACNPEYKVVSWSYSSNDPTRFAVFKPLEMNQ